MHHPDPVPQDAAPDDTRQAADRHWRARFIEHLATSSNVVEAAAAAGITPDRAYKLRRADPDFARAWSAAVAEGYLHLEMEVVRRLREGDLKTADSEKFDFPNAIRLLAAHRDTGGSGKGASKGKGASEVRDVSAAEVRASIERKIEDIRRRMERDKARKEAAG